MTYAVELRYTDPVRKWVVRRSDGLVVSRWQARLDAERDAASRNASAWCAARSVGLPNATPAARA